MTELSRRSFLRGALTVTAIAVAPKILTIPAVPILYGDGVHDDTNALQTLFNGETVSIEGEFFKVSSGVFKGGKFLISDAINIPGGGWNIDYIHLIRSPSFPPDRYTLRLVDCTRSYFGGLRLSGPR